MDNFAFEDTFEQERSQRTGRAKPVKRKWREIEAVKERNRLRKELQSIDLYGELDAFDIDF